jgi:predicted Zn-dependent protease
MLIVGVVGLLLYLLLPAIWAMKGNSDMTFLEVLRTNWINQKMYLTARVLRNRALLVSLTCVLPVILMGFRWPSSFGDTSAAGANLTNIAFRVIHLFFLAAWLYVVFDPKYSPRELSLLGLSFLTFYYLGALAVGYYAGYALLVFTSLPKRGGWHKESPISKLLNPVIRTAVVAAAILVPAGLAYKNYGSVHANNGKLLHEFAGKMASEIPDKQAYELSYDPYLLAILQAQLANSPKADKYVYVNTRALQIPNYHFELRKHYGNRWPDIGSKEEAGGMVDQGSLQYLVSALTSSNTVIYLHPSFGYFFEKVYATPLGQSYQLHTFEKEEILPPALSAEQLSENAKFWTDSEPFLTKIERLRKNDSLDAQYLLQFYSRAANNWGALLQRNEKFDAAEKKFALACRFNTNNLASDLNLRFSQARKKDEAFKDLDEIRERFRSWNNLLAEGGAVDEPNVCQMIGEVFLTQSQYRQSALYLSRTAYFQPTNYYARASLAKAFLAGMWIDRARDEIAKTRSDIPSLNVTNQCELIALEAACDFNEGKRDAAEQRLLAARAKYPTQTSIALSLAELYRSTDRPEKSLAMLDEVTLANPDNAGLKVKKAELLLTLKQSEKAHLLIDQAMALKPKDSSMMLYAAFVNIQEKKFDEATKLLDKILESDSENVQALIYKANIAIEKKEDNKSFEALDKALQIQPSNVPALRNRAILNLRLNNLSAAKRDYETLQRILPRSHIVFYGLGDIAYKRKDFDEAAKYFESYLKYAPATGSKELLEERDAVRKRLAEIRAAKT